MQGSVAQQLGAAEAARLVVKLCKGLVLLHIADETRCARIALQMFAGRLTLVQQHACDLLILPGRCGLPREVHRRMRDQA